MNKIYLRGDMYYANLGKGIGSEQKGYRPVLIIQNNTGNKNSNTVIVAAITSKISMKPNLPTHYLICAESGLKYTSLILLEQIFTIDKARLQEYIGHIKNEHFEAVNKALSISIGIEEEKVKNEFVICLCSSCLKNFLNTERFAVTRLESKEKDTCTYCQQRKGFDYKIERKE